MTAEEERPIYTGPTTIGELIAQKDRGGAILSRQKKHYEILHFDNLPAEEQLKIRQAEFLMLAAMRNKGSRGDLLPYETHSYDVAIINVGELGGGADEAVKALLHDTIEDSGGIVTEELIGDYFGSQTATTVDKLTKLRSGGKKPRDLTEHTHQLLHSLIMHDINAITVKIADRLHGMRTIAGLRPDRQMFKARETLDFYVPLTSALGFHGAARELASLSLAVLKPEISPGANDPMEKAAAKWEKRQILLENRHGICMEIRKPTPYDCYKAAEGDLDGMENATAPLFVIAIYDPEKLPGKMSDFSFRDVFVNTALEEGLLTEREYEDLRSKNEKTRSNRLETKRGEVPVRLVFVTRDDDEVRKVTVFSVRSSDPAQRAYAEEKIRQIKTAYKLIMESKKLRQSVRATNELFEHGIISAEIENNRQGDFTEAAIERGATVLDLAVWYAGEPDKTRIGKISEIGTNGVSRECDFWEEIKPGGRYKIEYTGEEACQPDWLDSLKTRVAKEAVRSYLKDSVNRTRAFNSDPDPDSVAYRALVRGERIINEAYRGILEELKFSYQPLLTDISRVQELYFQIKGKYLPGMVGNWSEQERLANFLISVGLGDVKKDRLRKSTVWQVARELVRIQYSLKPIEFILDNESGALNRITGRLTDFNIVNVFFRNIQREPGKRRIILWFEPDEYRRIFKSRESLLSGFNCIFSG